MNAFKDTRSAKDGRKRAAGTRPPLLKMTRALVSTALAQGQTRTALELLASGFRTARSLPAAQQVDLAITAAKNIATRPPSNAPASMIDTAYELAFS